MLSEALVEAVAGRSPRLLVTMPPRHGKSELISHYAPIWYLNKYPERRVMLASYEADFAASWGRKVRNTIVQNEAILQVRIAGDSAAANRWDTTAGGGMVTAGVGGPLTGRGANLLIVDDPVKNAEEAASQVYREKTWDWWASTAYTRLEPGGAAVVVMTRWHEDDLAGRLLRESEQGGERWTSLRLPALAEAGDPLGREPGEALWPYRYDEAALERIQQAVGSRVWSALYQQSPHPTEGAMFQRAWFPIVDAAPADCRRVRYWDLAATEARAGSDPDWTAGCLLAKKDGIYYVQDMRRIRGTPLQVEALIRQTAELDGRATHIWMEQEPGSSGVNTIDHYTRRVLAGYVFRGNRTTGSKTERAAPLASQAEAGNVRLVRGPWVGAFLDELESFPLGAHDDQVDACSGAFERLLGGGGVLFV